MHLRIQIPAFDEEAALPSVVEGALAAGRNLVDDGTVSAMSLLIIDDGSTDRTGAIAQRLASEESEVSAIGHPHNLGLGATFRHGVTRALGEDVDLLLHVDADGQFDPSDVRRLVEAGLTSGAGLVTGSRFLDERPDPPIPLVRRWGNRGIAWMISALGGRRLRDVSCGFRLFTREGLRALKLSGDFTYTHESILDLVAAGHDVVEVPVRVRGVRPHGRSRLARSTIAYGCKASVIILRAWRRSPAKR